MRMSTVRIVENDSQRCRDCGAVLKRPSNPRSLAAKRAWKKRLAAESNAKRNLRQMDREFRQRVAREA